MSLTYTSALERNDPRRSNAVRWHDGGDLLLVATTVVGVLAIGLAYSGRVRKFDLENARAANAATNLSTASDATQLEAAVGLLLTDPANRRLAARALYQFIRKLRDAGEELPNVGAIARATRPGASPDDRQRLFSAEDLATLKPVLVVRTVDEFRRSVLLHSALLIVPFYALWLVWRIGHRRGDLLLLSAAHLLTTLGFAILLSRPDPVRDTLLFARYSQTVILGLAVMATVSFIDFRQAAFLELSYVPLIGALGLSTLLLVFGKGPGMSAAKVNLGPIQPIEAIRLLLALFLAGYFSRRWELLRQVRAQEIRRYRVPAWLNLPRADYVVPVVVGVGASLVFFFLQKDLGPALFLSCVFLAMYAVARRRPLLALAGVTLLVAGFYIGYRLNVSNTLAERVQMWQSPWDNVVRGGAQVAQAFWALATGGLFGTGLGLGDTRYLPAGHTDLVLAAIGEELGLVGLLAIAAVYVLIAWRGFRTARAATSDYGLFLATALTLFLVLPVLVMAAGILGITPLTGVVTPFLSYGGSAMAANFGALGLLTAIDTTPGSTTATEPFRVPLRWLGGVLAAGVVGLVIALVNVQVVHADDYVVKGHLTLQADGVRRFQYNQRLLDVARGIARGTVYDRGGLVLATGDAALARRAREEYGKLGVAPNSTCVEPSERCYPLGGMAFHLLGDASTRRNWSASNTSYVERDAEDRLRGFDDGATAVQSSDAAGRPAFTLKRDYRALVPILRHRYTPSHPAVKAFLGRTRDEHVTIDARLQLRVATILSTYASKSKGGKGAAVVLDPDSGDLLAVASYPWPAVGRGEVDSTIGTDALLDRARYALYPPGSTFKLVTAAAALRRDAGAGSNSFTCERLTDGRVGAKIRGWGRPVRDDVMDTRPHGTIDMHDGLVRSCNAYFAQLAVKIGPAALLETADRFGIAVAPGRSAERLRQTLPQAGYGQGDVLATPLKMARVAATFASGGILCDPRWNTPTASSPSFAKTEGALLTPEAAGLIGRYMRDVVLSGTGRSLSHNPWRIAGKTGTAELSGSPSHSWFVGFAPYGRATRRVAFAVIIEKAGYGSTAAAPVAGEIVDAAAALGIIQ